VAAWQPSPTPISAPFDAVVLTKSADIGDIVTQRSSHNARLPLSPSPTKSLQVKDERDQPSHSRPACEINWMPRAIRLQGGSRHRASRPGDGHGEGSFLTDPRFCRR
jgi:hypothetical protein